MEEEKTGNTVPTLYCCSVNVEGVQDGQGRNTLFNMFTAQDGNSIKAIKVPSSGRSSRSKIRMKIKMIKWLKKEKKKKRRETELDWLDCLSRHIWKKK